MKTIIAAIMCLCACSCASQRPAVDAEGVPTAAHTDAVAVANTVAMDLLAEVNLSHRVEGLGRLLSVLDYDRAVTADPVGGVVSVHYSLRSHPAWIGHPRSFSVVVHTGTLQTRLFRLSDSQRQGGPVYEMLSDTDGKPEPQTQGRASGDDKIEDGDDKE